MGNAKANERKTAAYENVFQALTGTLLIDDTRVAV